MFAYKILMGDEIASSTLGFNHNNYYKSPVQSPIKSTTKRKPTK